MKIKPEAQLKMARFQFMKLKANNDVLCEAINIAENTLKSLSHESYKEKNLLPDCACHTVVDKAVEKIEELKSKLT
jgi:hypothetical protein